MSEFITAHKEELLFLITAALTTVIAMSTYMMGVRYGFKKGFEFGQEYQKHEQEIKEGKRWRMSM